MVPKQISLWDNEALETGYRCMAQLKFEEAIGHFKEALVTVFCDQKTTNEAIEACEYWQPHVKEEELTIVSVNQFLFEYQQYQFTPLMASTRNALVRFAARSLTETPVSNMETMEVIFDLFLSLKDYSGAIDFLTNLTDRHPENHTLLYYLAQAQWLDGNQSAANDHYLAAIIYHPEKSFLPKIINDHLLKLIESYGMENTPAYGWILGRVPLVHLKEDILERDEKHARALRCYKLLKLAHNSSEQNDKNSRIQFSKQLKLENPEMYQLFFKERISSFQV